MGVDGNTHRCPFFCLVSKANVLGMHRHTANWNNSDCDVILCNYTIRNLSCKSGCPVRDL